MKSPGLTWELHVILVVLEYVRGKENSRCSGEMRRDLEEYRWQRQLPGIILTLRFESVGSKQD